MTNFNITYVQVKVELINSNHIKLGNSDNHLIGDHEYINGKATNKVILRGVRGSQNQTLIIGKDCQIIP